MGSQTRVDLGDNPVGTPPNEDEKIQIKKAIDLHHVDNTSDLNKPVSTAQQVALALKADTSFSNVPDSSVKARHLDGNILNDLSYNTVEIAVSEINLDFTTHAHRTLEIYSAESFDVFIPTDASSDFAVGSVVSFVLMREDITVRIAPSAGVSLQNQGYLLPFKQIFLRKLGSNAWALLGDIIPTNMAVIVNSSIEFNFSHIGKIIEITTENEVMLTVPNDSTRNFPIGTIINVVDVSAVGSSPPGPGSHEKIIDGADGVLIRNLGGLIPNSEVSLRKRANNDWILSGAVIDA